ncbi:MAG TPA: radical SAM family heme chaperone HemW [Bacteroidia bacterium]|nr:radical SAM family heme chaperone HemW [Bacteroidia bacterium]
MQGLYIHIPFCRKACHYCDFHFSTSLKLKDQLLAALKNEILLRKNYLPTPALDTIYFGGGTPSLLSFGELKDILDTVASVFEVQNGAEITLEANPDDISAEKVTELKRAGVNRLSIGIQSFFEEDLAWMNRAHNAGQAARCIDIALQSGIDNITADLIYGFPLLTDEKWEKNIQTMLESGINHLSAYSLTVEPRTALAARIKKGADRPVENEHAARQFVMLMDVMEQARWEHYEISNFCKPGNYARHNTNYWKNQPYIGIGPSAHSYNGKARQWSVANNAGYIAALEKNTVPYEIEELTSGNTFNEYILTGLRTKWGINTDFINEKWGADFLNSIQDDLRTFTRQGLITTEGTTITLTRNGKLVADYISSELMAV